MKERAKQFWKNNHNFRKIVGVIFVIVGFLAIVTPLTPGGLLFFIGLEILGIEFLFWNKIKAKFFKKKSENIDEQL